MNVRRKGKRAFNQLSRTAHSYLGGRLHCPVCGANPRAFDRLDDEFFRQMDRHQCIHSIFTFETLNVLEYSCPVCEASDRDRLYALYISQRSAESRRKLDFIDFAPVPGLSPYLRSLPNLNYRSADLYSERADDKVDLTDMKLYRANSIDAFLCSHVLEHVDDDRQAMRELYRVLKPGGWGIAMVPIQLTIDEVMEDASVTSEADRWKYFCQNDHLRLYSKQGFISRLEEAGFAVRQLGVEHFGEETFRRHGIHPRSILYVAEKQ